ERDALVSGAHGSAGRDARGGGDAVEGLEHEQIEVGGGVLERDGDGAVALDFERMGIFGPSQTAGASVSVVDVLLLAGVPGFEILRAAEQGAGLGAQWGGRAGASLADSGPP